MAKITRKTWHYWHRIAGLNLALLTGFILLTGTVAVLSHELDYLFNPALRAQATPLSNFNWSRAYQALSIAADKKQIESISLPQHQGFSAEAIVVDANGHRSRLYLDPTEYQVTGEGRWYNWQTTLRQLHRHLMLPLWLGLAIVSALSFLTLVSLVSGLCLYRHWWKGLWQLPRRHNARLFWTDLHRFTGLWSVWLLAVITLTGIWYFVEQHGFKARFPQQAGWQQTDKGIPQVNAIVLNSAVLTVKAERPSLQINAIFFPQKPGDPLRIDGQDGTVLVRDRANNLLFNPLTGALLDQRYGSDLSMHVRIAEAADPLHFGNWGGYWSKIPWFIFGLILSSLTLTGTYLVALRDVKVNRGTTSVPQHKLLVLGMAQMGKMVFPAGGLILASLILTAINVLG